ncbi:MAG: TetR family transcriptional regulator [Streptosporangiaceae bacterium]
MATAMGLRERKAARTREEISRVAIGLFCARGFDSVTMTEIAEAAEVGRATLFAYFPSKEALVLDRVQDDDPCRVFSGRGPGVSLAGALRAHYRELAAQFGPREAEGTKRIMELILSTPALTAGLHRMFDRQRDELAALLAAEDTTDTSGFTAQVVAAQTIGVVLAVKSRIYERLVAGELAGAAPACLAEEVDMAFGLLETGIGSSHRKEAT